MGLVMAVTKMFVRRRRNPPRKMSQRRTRYEKICFLFLVVVDVVVVEVVVQQWTVEGGTAFTVKQGCREHGLRKHDFEDPKLTLKVVCGTE